MSKPIDRRSLLRGALASGALYSLDALFTAERTNAAAVGPNDKIKVTKVESFVLKNSWVFVKVSTDAGIVGWGEMLKDDAKACAAGALEVGRYLVGQDPNRVVFHWQAIHRGAFYRGLRLMSLDGTCLDVADTPENEAAFGRPGSSRRAGGGAFPQLRLVALAESGTHAICDAALGPYASSEKELADQLLGGLRTHE